MANARNSRTTHPRKAQRRASAKEIFTVARVRMTDAEYMARKQQEWIALGGSGEQFAHVPQRVFALRPSRQAA